MLSGTKTRRDGTGTRARRQTHDEAGRQLMSRSVLRDFPPAFFLATSPECSRTYISVPCVETMTFLQVSNFEVLVVCRCVRTGDNQRKFT